MDRVALAALNNARWCAAVCGSHGCSVRFEDGLLICDGPRPPYYPAAVTLAPRAQVSLERIGATEFKDSFSDVDGVAMGLRCLFDASWIWLTAPMGTPSLKWSRVSSDAELMEWERHWDTLPQRQFLPTLPEDSDIAFMWAHRDGEPVMGCILNLTEPVVGLSNTWHADGLDPWPELAAVSKIVYPSRPVVGYERGDSLSSAVSAGFEEIGLLRVWVR